MRFIASLRVVDAYNPDFDAHQDNSVALDSYSDASIGAQELTRNGL
jgi:hypothetical protein